MDVTYHLVALGTSYLDINFVHFPFTDGLFAHRETVGTDYVVQPGGSALNVARVAASLGLRAAFIGKVGKDEIGTMLSKLLSTEGVRPFFITDSGVQTNLAVHYVKNDGVSIMTSGGSANQNLQADELLQQVKEITTQTTFLYLGGGFKTKHLLPYYSEFIRLAHTAGAKIVLDHGRVTNLVSAQDIATMKAIVADVDVYVPSKDELLSVWDATSVTEAAKSIRRLSPAMLVIKDADHGSWYATPEDPDHVFQVDAYRHAQVINSVGAGDSFNAGLIYGMSNHFPIQEAVELATATASVKIAAQVKVSQNSVYSFMQQNPRLNVKVIEAFTF